MPHYDEARGLLSGVVAQNATLVADATHASTSKATPVDADELPLADSASSFSLKKLTWANLKATLATWIAGNLISGSFTSLTTSGGAVVNGAAGLTMSGGTSTGVAGEIAFGNSRAIRYRNAAGTANLNVLYLNATDDLVFGGSAVSSIIASVAGTGTVGTFNAGGLTLNGAITVNTPASIVKTSVALTNGAGVAAGTIANAPVAGNPTKWIGINDNGTIRYIPAW